MGRVYERAPLIEALCEFRFQEDKKNWDLTLPGLFYQKVEETFPVKREQNAIELQVNAGDEVLGKVTPRLQFFSVDERRLIQLGPGMLSANYLPPYPSWQEFRELIQFALNSFLSVTTSPQLTRIGLRYINKINLDATAPLGQYLHYHPALPASLGGSMCNVVQRVELDFPAENGLLVFTLASTPSDSQAIHSLILDIDFAIRDASLVSLATALAWVDKAHDQVELVFEASITDELRQTFEERAS